MFGSILVGQNTCRLLSYLLLKSCLTVIGKEKPPKHSINHSVPPKIWWACRIWEIRPHQLFRSCVPQWHISSHSAYKSITFVLQTSPGGSSSLVDSVASSPALFGYPSWSCSPKTTCFWILDSFLHFGGGKILHRGLIKLLNTGIKGKICGGVLFGLFFCGFFVYRVKMPHWT